MPANHILVIAKHVMVEKMPPGLALRGRQIPYRQNGVHQSVQWRSHVRSAGVPPVIDQDINAFQPFDVVPPHAGHVQCVARRHLDHLCMRNGLLKPGKALKIGSLEIDHADGLSGRCVIDRPDIEIRQLIGWQENETTTARAHHRNIFQHIIVRGDTVPAREILDELEKMRPQGKASADDIARVHIALGQLDQAFEWLDRALDERALFVIYLNVHPCYAPLRSDERYRRCLERLGLSD